ncbi:MAG: ABC transporter ATP-binding protein [Clostridiales bacterium]|nr:ABC transporter ATP-binding protein [Clostridiales bacterium]
MDEIIRINNVSKAYRMYENPADRVKEVFSVKKKSYHRDFFALKNINISIKKGENIGIIGKNGCGKSTLLKIITGILQPSQGSVKVEGRISAILELGAGFNPEYTGIENIYTNGMIMGFSRKQMEEKVNDIIQFADLGDFINQPVKTYSSGMYARLAFSVAINIEPDILIVDEALSVGDMGFQHKCMNKMKELIDTGVTVIFVSHDTFAIKSLCQRCIYLKDGEVLADGNAIQVTDLYLMDTRKKIYTAEEKEIEAANKTATEEIEADLPKIEVEEQEAVEEKKYESLRYGTGGIKIKRVVMTNDAGEECDHFEYNQMMNLNIFAKCYKDVQNLNCCIRIRDKNGIDITGTTTYEEKIKIRPLKKDESVEISFRAPNKLKHDMTFSVGVTLNDTRNIADQTILDHIDIAYTFKSVYNPERPVWYTYYQDYDIKYDIKE